MGGGRKQKDSSCKYQKKENRNSASQNEEEDQDRHYSAESNDAQTNFTGNSRKRSASKSSTTVKDKSKRNKRRHDTEQNNVEDELGVDLDYEDDFMLEDEFQGENTTTMVNFNDHNGKLAMTVTASESQLDKDQSDEEEINAEDTGDEQSQPESELNDRSMNNFKDKDEVITMSKLQEFFKANGLLKQSLEEPERNKRGELSKNNYNNSACNSSSETTIYRQAVEPLISSNVEVDKKLMELRFSSSSEEAIDSDDVGYDDGEVIFKSSNFVENQRSRDNKFCSSEHRGSEEPRPSTSRGDDRPRIDHHPVERKRSTVEERAERMIRDAETAKARMFNSPGKQPNIFNNSGSAEMGQFKDIDDNFNVITLHMDETVVIKIAKHEYVDFARLVQRDKVDREDDHRMEMINKGGKTWWVPVSDREGTAISSFFRWEQAFRVFSSIYTRFFPGKASELVEYNHVIFGASLTYIWDNVYKYDKDFRMHLSNYPERGWNRILQKSWAFRLKDKIPKSMDLNSSFEPTRRRDSGREICRRFNKGKCSYGLRCKYDHRCLICNKWGHGAYTCHRVKRDSDRGDRSEFFDRRDGRNDKIKEESSKH